MNRKQRFEQLEELCQQRYAIIDSCYRQIASAQKELAKLETKYLRAKNLYESTTYVEPLTAEQKKRRTKVEKLRKQLQSLGIENVEELLNKVK